MNRQQPGPRPTSDRPAYSSSKSASEVGCRTAVSLILFIFRSKGYNSVYLCTQR